MPTPEPPIGQMPIPGPNEAPLHNLLICNNNSLWDDWWHCPPQCRARAWGERYSPRRPPWEETPHAD